MRKWLLFLVGATCFLSGHRIADALGSLPTVPYPAFALRDREEGEVIVLVTFARDGHVSNCSVERSSVSPALDDATVSYIKSNWQSPDFRGSTIRCPVEYILPTPFLAGLAGLHLPKPPYPERARMLGVQGTVLLNIRFDSAGEVSACRDLSAERQPLLEKPVIDFVNEYYHLPKLAGDSITVPFTFALPK
jgi:TonB family protein